MDYFEFKRDFDKKRSKLKLPTDCQELMPPSVDVASLYGWSFEWILTFADHKYLRVWEHHSKRPGLQDAARKSFAYHYGPITGQDPEGKLLRANTDPVDIRIDTSPRPVHMHFGAPEPHIQQESVLDLELERIAMFVFLKAILRHRQSRVPINEALGFRIKVKS